MYFPFKRIANYLNSLKEEFAELDQERVIIPRNDEEAIADLTKERRRASGLETSNISWAEIFARTPHPPCG